MTSHDVVRQVRRAVGERGVGHAGTLDPMATGLLVVAAGEARKLLRWLSGADKRYLATVSLGRETDSHDAHGRVVREAPVPAGLSRDDVARVARTFVGTFRQRVPVVSAVRRGGERLYARVRRGESVEAPERDVTVRALAVLDVRPAQAEVDLDIECAKGFYVRALARDLAAALGTVGHLVSLRRIRSGAFDVADAVDADTVRAAAGGDTAARERVVTALLPLACVVPAASRLVLDAAGCDDAAHGRAVARERLVAGAWPGAGAEPLLLVDEHGAPVAVARAEVDALRVVRGFVVRRA